MFLVINAIMSGAEGWNDIETYGDSKIDWLRQHRPFANGIPRRHTVARILRCIVAKFAQRAKNVKLAFGI